MSALGWWLAGLMTWPLLLCAWALIGIALGHWKVTTTRTINRAMSDNDQPDNVITGVVAAWPQPGDTVYGLQLRNGQWVYNERPFAVHGTQAREYRVINDRNEIEATND